MSKNIIIAICVFLVLSVVVYFINRHDEPTIIKNYQIKDTEITLYRSNSKNGKYILKLVSNKTIIEPIVSIPQYILIRTLIEDDTEIYKFSLTFKESYTYDNDSKLLIKIILIQKNQTLTCGSSFLKTLDSKHIYNLKIDITENNASCHIEEN